MFHFCIYLLSPSGHSDIFFFSSGSDLVVLCLLSLTLISIVSSGILVEKTHHPFRIRNAIMVHEIRTFILLLWNKRQALKTLESYSGLLSNLKISQLKGWSSDFGKRNFDPQWCLQKWQDEEYCIRVLCCKLCPICIYALTHIQIIAAQCYNVAWIIFDKSRKLHFSYFLAFR